jgi:nucleoside-diphosphate-sugar epimerase
LNVLIVGGNRFLGQLLTFRLLAGGHTVTLFNRGNLPDPFGARVERLRGDRTTVDFRRLVGGRPFDAVVDFAAFEGQDVAEAVGVLGERVGHYVLISTGQVYLVREGSPKPAREQDYAGALLPEPPRESPDHEEWRYGVGKRACEDVLASAFAERGFPGTRLRIPMVNGERDYHRRIEGYLWRLLDGGPVIVPDGGVVRVRHVYGGAVVAAITRLLGDPRTFGQAYNLCQDETPTLLEMVELLQELVGSHAPLVPVASSEIEAAGLTTVKVSPFSTRWMSFLDPTRARRELSFVHPAVSTYAAAIVASQLAHWPADPPAGYLRRADERRLAERA